MVITDIRLFNLYQKLALFAIKRFIELDSLFYIKKCLFFPKSQKCRDKLDSDGESLRTIGFTWAWSMASFGTELQDLVHHRGNGGDDAWTTKNHGDDGGGGLLIHFHLLRLLLASKTTNGDAGRRNYCPSTRIPDVAVVRQSISLWIYRLIDWAENGLRLLFFN